VDRADAAVAAGSDRYTDVASRLRVRRSDFADPTEAATLPERSFDLVTMRLVQSSCPTRRPWRSWCAGSWLRVGWGW
jgi:hypothetical protein